jgi:hypothetical protein
MFHTYVACVIRILHMGCNGFQVCFGCVFKCFISMFQVFQLPLDVCCNHCILDVSKVDLVLHLSFSHLILHRLSRSRQDIHTNEGRARDEGAACAGRKRGSCVMLPRERDGRWAEGAAYVVILGAGRRRMVTWAWRASTLLLR